MCVYRRCRFAVYFARESFQRVFKCTANNAVRHFLYSELFLFWYFHLPYDYDDDDVDGNIANSESTLKPTQLINMDFEIETVYRGGCKRGVSHSINRTINCIIYADWFNLICVLTQLAWHQSSIRPFSELISRYMYFVFVHKHPTTEFHAGHQICMHGKYVSFKISPNHYWNQITMNNGRDECDLTF